MELNVFGHMYCRTSGHVVQAVQPMSYASTQEMKNGVGGGMAQAVVCPCLGAYTVMLCNCKQ